MFLTREEVRELTGYKRKSDQCRRLAERGYPFETDKDGYPKVPRSFVEAKFQTKVGGPRLRAA